MTDDKPRLGPWLRHYAEEERPSKRERAQEILVGGAAVVGFLVVLAGVLWAFVRYPIPTFATLVAIWLIGLVVLLFRRRLAGPPEPKVRLGLDDIDRK